MLFIDVYVLMVVCLGDVLGEIWRFLPHWCQKWAKEHLEREMDKLIDKARWASSQGTEHSTSLDRKDRNSAKEFTLEQCTHSNQECSIIVGIAQHLARSSSSDWTIKLIRPGRLPNMQQQNPPGWMTTGVYGSLLLQCGVRDICLFL